MDCSCRQVRSLRFLCLKTFENSLLAIFTKFLKSASASFADCSAQFDEIMGQACGAPESLHNEITHRLLKAAFTLSADEKKNDSDEPSAVHQLVVQRLISAITRLKPKKVSLAFFRSSELAYCTLYDILGRMTTVEKFRCWGLASLTLGRQRFFKNCRSWLTNLTFFSCSDCSNEILTTICRTCTLIQTIKVIGRINVTDDCISSLATCKNLREVELDGTSVTAEGYVQLLLDTQSVTLFNIGEFESKVLVELLDHLEAIPFRTFNIQKFTHYVGAFVSDPNCFPGLVKFFPELTRLQLLFHFHNLPPNFKVLDGLKSVTEASLVIVVFEEDHFSLKNFVSLKSSLLTYLSVSCAGKPCIKVKTSDIINIGLNCPNLERLLITELLFSDDFDCSAFDHLPTKPFLKLKELGFNTSGSSLFKSILCHTFNIESVSIVGKRSVTDDFFTYIFNNNPSERLKILSIKTKNEISVHVLKFIINSCTRLSHLGCMKECTALSLKELQEIYLMAAQRYGLKLT